MKTKDMPSIRARKFADDVYRKFRHPDGSMNAMLAKHQLITAYMAGYRHGRKMAQVKADMHGENGNG